MESKKAATLVGITVILAFTMIVVSVFYLRGYFAARDKASYYAMFDNVGRLAAGDNVTVAGVGVGRVSTIRLTGGHARVDFFVSNSVLVPDGTVAAINATDVFGSASVELRLGEGEPLPAGSRLDGELGPGIEDIMRRSAVIIDQTISLLNKAETLISRISELAAEEGALSEGLDDARVVAANVREFSYNLEDYDRMLRRALASIDSTAASLDTLVVSNAEGVKNTLDRFQSLGERMETLLARLDSGEGTMGRLLKDESLYQDLQDTLLEARTLMSEVRDHPGKFIRVKVF